MHQPASPANNWHYNSTLKVRASELRRNPTKAEKRLWYRLLRNQQTGYKFMRQRPILSYIVDCFCKDLRLVIEVDGWTHLLEEQMEYDLTRQAKLESLGLTILRFTDNEVWDEMDRVQKQLLGWISLQEEHMNVNLL